MIESYEAEELRSRGKVLVIKSPFLPKQPTPVDHWVAPESPEALARKAAGIARARYLADLVVAQLDPAVQARVVDLAMAQRAANQALNDARNQLAALSVPQPADVDLDLLVAHEGRRAALERHLPILQARSQAANDALGTAITETRSDLEIIGLKTTFKEAQRELHAIDAQIETLQQQRGDLERALRDARGMVGTWGSTAYHPPVQVAPVAPAAVPEPAKSRRRLFD